MQCGLQNFSPHITKQSIQGWIWSWKTKAFNISQKHSLSQYSKFMPWPKCWGRWSWMVLRRLTKPSRTNTPKRCPFHYRGLECKRRKSRASWSNSKFGLGVQTKQVKANRVLPRECTGHSKHPLPTMQQKTLHMDITRWSTQKSDWLYSLQSKMEKLYTVSRNKTSSWLWLRSWTPYCQIQT